MVDAEETSADVVVLGGGTAGCIIAGRIALATDLGVVLVEEGPDDEPELVRDLRQQTTLLRTDYVRRYPEDHPDGGGTTLLSGRVLGGGWAVNHSAMVRPTDADLVALEHAGGPDWNVEHLRQLMIALEHDVDYGDQPGHGSDGPVRLARRYHRGEAAVPAVTALLAACEASDIPFLDDVNAGGDTSGISAYPYASDGHVRRNSANSHLAAARERPGLTVMGDTTVHRILFEGDVAVGVEVSPAGDPTGPRTTIRARHIIVCAGVFHAPQILLRSGIGPAGELERAGIPVLVDLPGVGSGFLDHGKVEIEFSLRPTAEDRQRPALDFGDGLKLHLRLRSRLAGVDPDLDLGLRHVPDAGKMVLTVRLLEQRAEGKVSLDPQHPEDLPRVRTGILEHEDDVAALVDGVLRGIALLEHPLLEGRYALSQDLPRDRADWEQWVRHEYGTYNHGTGTCRMGTDERAVVDTELQVRGVQGVTVADASVLPTLPHSNTNYAVALIAEHAADAFLKRHAAIREHGAAAN